MSRSLIQSAGHQNTATGTTVSCTFGSGTTAGSQIIAAVAGTGGVAAPTFTVSDGTNTYTSCTGSRVTSASLGYACELFQFNNIGSGITTITATASRSGTYSIAAAEFSGSNLTTPFDKATGQTGTGTSPSSGTATASGTADLEISALADDGMSEADAQTLTPTNGWTSLVNLGSNGLTTVSIGLQWTAIAGGTITATWGESPAVTWLCNVASFNAGGGGGGAVQPVPKAAVVRMPDVIPPPGAGGYYVDDPQFGLPPGQKLNPASVVREQPERPGHPGGVAAMGPGGPFVLPTTIAPAPARIVRGGDPPPPPGVVIVAGPGGPFDIGTGAKLPVGTVAALSPVAGHPGGVIVNRQTAQPQPQQPWQVTKVAAERPAPPPPGGVFASASRDKPAIPFRPWVGLPIVEAARPGDPGRVISTATSTPTDPGQPRPVVVREPDRPGDPGAVRALASPPPPVVRLPTGQRMVVRDVDPIPPPGGVISRMSPVQLNPTPRAAVAVRQTDVEPSWLAGWVKSGATMAPPEPAPTRAYIATIPATVQPVGGVMTARSIDRADPPGRLIPRPVVIRELERPAGLVQPGGWMAYHAAWDFTLPEVTPIFESAEAPTFTSTATTGFNTGVRVGIPVFRAKRVP